MPSKPSKPFAWLDLMLCLILLALTGWLNYQVGYERSFFLFYLGPILFTWRRLGLFFANGMCVLAVLTWLASNILSGETFPDWFTLFWNTMTPLLVFLLVVVLFALRGTLEHQVRQRTDAWGDQIIESSRLEKKVLEASEREQRRIGHDLHDSLGQHLTATALAGKVLANNLASQARPEAATANQMVQLVEQAIELTRTLARSLHPVAMRAEGLVDALAELAANISRSFSVACKLDCPQTVSLATAEANMHLYRIVQEAISNAVRHGRAKTIVIHLEKVNNEIKLAITDDGVGLAPDAKTKSGLGLHIMNYRAGMIGANLQVKGLPGGGTQVTCLLPVGGNNFSENHG